MQPESQDCFPGEDRATAMDTGMMMGGMMAPINRGNVQVSALPVKSLPQVTSTL